jgi:hypothetical protein
MAEIKGTGDLVPDLPEPHGQSAQTAPTVAIVVASPSRPSEYLGQDLAADYSGIVLASRQVVLNDAAVSALNSHMLTLREGKKQAESELLIERAQNKTLTGRASDAEKDVAVLQTKLSAERESSSTRVFLNALGGAAVGFMPYAYDKTGAIGALVVGLFGGALLLKAWRSQTGGQP